MARKTRRRAHRPRRYADGTEIPAELLERLPPDEAISYVGGTPHVRDLALIVFRELPDLAHAVLVLDVLGGVHAVRCFERSRGLRLPEVVSLVGPEVDDPPFVTALLYLTRGDRLPSDAATQLYELQWEHPNPPFLSDVLVVDSDRGIVWSLAERKAMVPPAWRDN
jgi:hypothetical protein